MALLSFGGDPPRRHRSGNRDGYQVPDDGCYPGEDHQPEAAQDNAADGPILNDTRRGPHDESSNTALANESVDMAKNVGDLVVAVKGAASGPVGGSHRVEGSYRAPRSGHRQHGPNDLPIAQDKASGDGPRHGLDRENCHLFSNSEIRVRRTNYEETLCREANTEKRGQGAMGIARALMYAL